MTTGQKWLTGCGIGCGVLLLAGIGACVAGALFMKHTFRGIEKAAESHEELIGELGDVDEYAPPATGSPAADRLEIFVADQGGHGGRPARGGGGGSPAPAARALRGGGRDREDPRGSRRPRRLHRRHRHLRGGPQPRPDRARHGPGRVRVPLHPHLPLLARPRPGGGPGDPRGAGRGPGRCLRRQQRPLQRGGGAASLPPLRPRHGAGADGRSTGPEAEAGEGEAWRARLEREIQRLEVDPGRVLWQDGLPADHRGGPRALPARLEATWSASTNRVELPLAEHETPWEWR